MTIEVKICGVNSPEAARAVAESRADLAGFVFFPKSPRHVTPQQAAQIAAGLPGHIIKVALFVDPDDETIANTLSLFPFDMIQLHGSESRERVAAAKSRFGRPVIKAVKLAQSSDLAEAVQFERVADRLLFDAKAPPTLKNALPGGNALAFDWELLRGFSAPVSWMLSGGLNPENVAEAIQTSGAHSVDVSSGVEDRPGHKDPQRIARFVAAAKATR